MSTYRRMRRQARQARRSGLQPMMVINTGEPVPRDRRRGAAAGGMAVPLRACAPRRYRWPRGGRLVAARHAAALVVPRCRAGRRGRVGCGPVRRAARIAHADRAHIRGHYHLRGRRVGFRRDRARPVRVAVSASAG